MKKSAAEFWSERTVAVLLTHLPFPTHHLSCGHGDTSPPWCDFLVTDREMQTLFSKNCGCIYWPILWLPEKSYGLLPLLGLSQNYLRVASVKCIERKIYTTYSHLGQGITDRKSGRQTKKPVTEEAGEGDTRRIRALKISYIDWGV